MLIFVYDMWTVWHVKLNSYLHALKRSRQILLYYLILFSLFYLFKYLNFLNLEIDRQNKTLTLASFFKKVFPSDIIIFKEKNTHVIQNTYSKACEVSFCLLTV